jgi:hypothetical protein
MPTTRSLSARPSLEFEKKEAKAFLRLLKAGDADALARARAQDSHFATAEPESFRLAHAQLIHAREYGFTSWPRLVHYCEGLEQQWLGRRWERSGGHAMNASQARQLLTLHRDRRLWAARVFAAFVPRYYGQRPEEVFAHPPTEAEAQLAYARAHGAPSWEALNAQDMFTGGRRDGHQRDEIVLLMDALDTQDLDKFKRLVEEYRDFLRLEAPASSNRMSLPRTILHRERRYGREAMAPFVAWLANHGYDIQTELNQMLAGRMKVEVDEIRWLLDRGADPSWVAPSGVPILEHALLIHWDPVTVDLIASHTKARQALWIAAGLGDREGVRRSLDAKGRPLPEAVKLRPPFEAVGAPSLASHPEPGDEELLMEALFVAMINGRVEVIKYLASRGAPLDSLVYGSPALNVAVGNTWVPVVEALIKGGARVDVKGSMPDQTPRELARAMHLDAPDRADRRRVAELCNAL